MSSNKCGLPSADLTAQLINDAVILSKYLRADFAEVASKRSELREQLMSEGKITRVFNSSKPLDNVCTIDGAHLPENDRASAYSISCALRVGQAAPLSGQTSCLALLPHLPCQDSLSAGLMIMQEILMAVDIIERSPGSFCLIDGSRISALRIINQFYSSLDHDLPHQLYYWRKQAQQQPDREPGRTLALFESRNWLSPYLSGHRIIGNAKLVTTISLVSRYAPEWVGRFDDKTFASLILEAGEALKPVPLRMPKEPYHIDSSYPYSKEVNKSGDQLTIADHPNQIFHVYYRPDACHGVFKIEMNGAFINNSELFEALLAWWSHELRTPDIQEPYSLYIADRFASEAVSVAKSAIWELARRDESIAICNWM